MIKSSVTAISYGDPIQGANKGLYEGIQKNLLKIEANQKSLCPVAENNGGFLRDSIGNRIEIKVYGVQGEVGSGVLYPVDYGVHQEFGTYKMVAQPFIRPGAETVVSSGESKAIMVKYGREQMEKELTERKRKRELNG